MSLSNKDLINERELSGSKPGFLVQPACYGTAQRANLGAFPRRDFCRVVKDICFAYGSISLRGLEG